MQIAATLQDFDKWQLQDDRIGFVPNPEAITARVPSLADRIHPHLCDGLRCVQKGSIEIREVQSFLIPMEAFSVK